MRKDFENVHRMAHSIKGSALNLRLPALAKPASKLDAKAKNKDLSGADNDFDEMQAAFNAFIEKIQENNNA